MQILSRVVDAASDCLSVGRPWNRRGMRTSHWRDTVRYLTALSEERKELEHLRQKKT